MENAKRKRVANESGRLICFSPPAAMQAAARLVGPSISLLGGEGVVLVEERKAGRPFLYKTYLGKRAEGFDWVLLSSIQAF